MVVKNPFLCERDSEIQFLVRNAGAYRGLSYLFPAASLENITKIAKIGSTTRLLLGQYRIKSENKKETGGILVTQATKVLYREFDEKFTYKTCQNYLNLLTDFRILIKMANEYVIHPYSKPLVFLLGDKIKPEISPIFSSIAWRCYFIDRLLFEDGDYFRAILKLYSSEYREEDEEVENAKSREYGVILHKLVFQVLKDRLKRDKFSYNIKRSVEKKIKEFDDFRDVLQKIRERKAEKELKSFLRRTELEYTVRRDWLRELGLIESKNGEELLTITGQKLFDEIRDRPLNQNFFNEHIFHILSNVYEMKDRTSIDKIPILEETFDKFTVGRLNILETLVLINTVILSAMPNFIGDRQSILEELKDACQKSLTKLVVENGYRTQDYYIKKRVNV